MAIVGRMATATAPVAATGTVVPTFSTSSAKRSVPSSRPAASPRLSTAFGQLMARCSRTSSSNLSSPAVDEQQQDAPSASSSDLEDFQEDVMWNFLKERHLHGDLISKVSDFVSRKHLDLGPLEMAELEEEPRDETDARLFGTSTSEDRKSGDIRANKKLLAEIWEKERKKTKQLNILRYEALKSELLLLTTGIGAACSIYCSLVFSIEAAASYALGVLSSCLYLQLLYYHSDKISKGSIPEVFTRKKPKRIGIRSDDLKDMAEKIIGGAAISLSSPRLVIPAAIYGFWAMSENLNYNSLDFQIVPGMLGFFAYKAAALVQVLRDNGDLRVIFPDDANSDNSQ